jgi:hypothetical protein
MRPRALQVDLESLRWVPSHSVPLFSKSLACGVGQEIGHGTMELEARVRRLTNASADGVRFKDHDFSTGAL